MSRCLKNHLQVRYQRVGQSMSSNDSVRSPVKEMQLVQREPVGSPRLGPELSHLSKEILPGLR